MKINDIPALLNKTIEKVVVSDSESVAPEHQVFLQFSDGTYVEFYSSSPILASSGHKGAAVDYARKFNKDKLFVFDE